MTILKIDIDHRRDYKKVKKFINFRLTWINYYYKVLPASVEVKRTHKGFHFTIDTSHSIILDRNHIIVFQLALGSDWLREIRNRYRVDSGMTEDWNLLFSRKVKITGERRTKKVLSQEKFVARYTLKGRLK